MPLSDKVLIGSRTSQRISEEDHILLPVYFVMMICLIGKVRAYFFC